MIKRVATVYIYLDIAIIIFCIAMDNYLWLLNSQIAFITAMSIVIGSFLGYKKNIETRLSKQNINPDEILLDRDKIDEIDDPYDLYSPINETKELSSEEIKTIIKDEKKKLKKSSFKNTLFSATGFFSIYRVVGYVVLVLGFFILTRNNLFEPFSYFGGILTVSIGTLLLRIKT
jgi:uncharacterized membrane protein YqgA involved in biofilm formation